MRRYLSAIAFFTTLFCTWGAHAAMSLDRMVVYFNPDRPWEDITVTNPDKQPLYLKTEVIKVEKPGTPAEKRIPISDPDKIQLLASPQKVIIPPGGRKTIRLVSLDVPEKNEAVYRVNFTPVIGKFKATETAVKVLIAYQALIFVRPQGSYFQVASQPEKKSITFTNKGDVNVLLRNGRYCPAEAKPEQCIKLKEGARLYAGGSWTLKLPASANPKGSVVYGLYDGSKEYDTHFSLSKKSESSLQKIG